MTIDELPPGSRVFIDANIFIYHFAGLSSQCTDLLLAIEQHHISGVTSTIVLAEVCHRRMIAEAVERYHLQPKQVVRRLKSQPALVNTLSQYRNDLRTIPKMGVRIRPILLHDITQSAQESQQSGLLTNDSINLAFVRRLQILYVATCDRDFDRVQDLAIWRPHDLIIPS